MTGKQLSFFPEPLPSPPWLKGRTYLYFREDGKLVHCNAIAGFIGEEYEHDDPNWQPPGDWPYEIIDWRKERG